MWCVWVGNVYRNTRSLLDSYLGARNLLEHVGGVGTAGVLVGVVLIGWVREVVGMLGWVDGSVSREEAGGRLSRRDKGPQEPHSSA